LARIRLSTPKTYQFVTDLRLRVTDINYGGHLGNDAVLGLAHEARIRFLRSMGFTESDVDGTGMLMADAAVLYRSEGRWGQQLKIEAAVTDITRTGCDFFFRLSDAETGTEIALVKTGMVFFDSTRRKIAPVPEAFLKNFD
jgi:acyl-CoA thioesterase FadM